MARRSGRGGPGEGREAAPRPQFVPPSELGTVNHARLVVVLASLRPRPVLETALASLVPQCRQAGAPLVVARRATEPDEAWIAQAAPGCLVVPCLQDDDVPRIRGRGLARASGDWVALTEDNCIADPQWLSRFQGHLDRGDEVIGGVMGNAATTRAIDAGAFFAEYGFFGPGKRETSTVFATGANVAYADELVPRIAEWALAGEWEDAIHSRLAAEGVRFSLAPDAVVRQQLRYTLAGFARDRFQHGHDFATVRARGFTPLRRVMWAGGAVLLPGMLAARIWRSTGRHQPRIFIRALPFTLAFLAAWAAGEALGYLRGAPRA